MHIYLVDTHTHVYTCIRVCVCVRVCMVPWCMHMCVQVRGQPQVLFLKCIYLVFSNRVSDWDLELTN